MRGISKSFPGVKALVDVSLDLYAGEVLALVGENGAGKSTLIKVLGCAHFPDAGDLEIDGIPARLRSPLEALRAGIALIYQEFNLVPGLSARENLFLGRESTRAGLFSRREERRRARAVFRRMGVELDPETLCRDLSVAQQQMVEIAKALAQNARILVLDEPTAALASREVAKLFAILRELKDQGLGMIYISHRLDEIYEIADRVLVMRDGQAIGTDRIANVSRDWIIERMVGRKLEQEFPQALPSIGEPRLAVEHLCRGQKVRDVSFCLRRGEIVGLTGLIGAGRTETARLLFGADRPDSGSISLDGRRLKLRCPQDAIRAGIALLTEDRKAQGLVLAHSARENFALPNLRAWSVGGMLRPAPERRAFDRYLERLRIKASSPETPARNLSGGTQQKIVLAKWLERNCEVILFDEPTRGIDVGAKYEIYQLIQHLAGQGKAILMISSELPEILGISHRILVMAQGRIQGEIREVERATQEQIMALAVGGTGGGSRRP